MFAIETEVAQSIANRLRAKVSAREKLAMQERPTKDLAAYDLYVQATSLIDKAAYMEARKGQGKRLFPSNRVAQSGDRARFRFSSRILQAG